MSLPYVNRIINQTPNDISRDHYDTCIRQHWYEERYRSAEGFTLPVDYSFDEWTTPGKAPRIAGGVCRYDYPV